MTLFHSVLELSKYALYQLINGRIDPKCPDSELADFQPCAPIPPWAYPLLSP